MIIDKRLCNSLDRVQLNISFNGEAGGKAIMSDNHVVRVTPRQTEAAFESTSTKLSCIDSNTLANFCFINTGVELHNNTTIVVCIHSVRNNCTICFCILNFFDKDTHVRVHGQQHARYFAVSVVLVM